MSKTTLYDFLRCCDHFGQTVGTAGQPKRFLNMKNRLLLLLLLSFLCGYTYISAQCDWNPVCISYCSDIWDGAGNTKTCFDPAGTSFTNPAKLNYCYKKQKEQFVLTSHPTNPSASWIRKRTPQFNVCIPDNICNLSFNLGEVKKNNETEIISPLENNSSVYTDINRLTPCEDCGNNKYFTLSSHRDILNSNGTYKMTLTYQCCDKDGNITGTGTSSFYYVLEDATSEVDVDIAFTASQTIETLNGDPDIDGILLTDGSFPGPELGPASAGVRIATVGNGIQEYTVELYGVDCDDPIGSGYLIHTQTIPYQGIQSINYSFLNIPNWESIINPDACYKVIVKVKSICGNYQDEAYFGLTNTCLFCRIINTHQEQEFGLAPLQSMIENDGSGNIEVRTKDANIREIHIMDSVGRLYSSQYDIASDHVSLSNIPIQFPIIVIIDEHGRVNKKMILQN